MSKLDDYLNSCGTIAHYNMNLVAGKRKPTNVALRFSTGEEILIAIMDTGRELSIDVDAFDEKDERKLTTFTFPEKGHMSPQIENLKTVVMVRR